MDRRKDLVGQIVNGWLLLEELPFDPPEDWSHQRKYNNRRFIARHQETGYELESTLTNIRNRRSSGPPRRQGKRGGDLTGRKIGVYQVIGPDEEAGPGMWKVCDTRTGHEMTKTRHGLLSHYNYILRTGRIRHLARSKDADFSVRQMYSAWQNLKQSTTNKSHRGYRYYGAYGVRMCHTWKLRFEAFRTDVLHEVGERPSKQHCLWPINIAFVMGPRNVQWVKRTDPKVPVAIQKGYEQTTKLNTQNTRMEKVTA